jgi:hypothetical protein
MSELRKQLIALRLEILRTGDPTPEQDKSFEKLWKVCGQELIDNGETFGAAHAALWGMCLQAEIQQAAESTGAK